MVFNQIHSVHFVSDLLVDVEDVEFWVFGEFQGKKYKELEED